MFDFLPKEERLRRVRESINDIEFAMACDDSVSCHSLTFAEAEEQLEFLKDIEKSLTKGDQQ